jgi:transposase-like protein
VPVRRRGYESLRRHGAKEALLVAWCIATDGRKHLLHLAVGNRESEAAWTEFFRQPAVPEHAPADHRHLGWGAPGLVNAIRACIRAKFPAETAGEVLAHVYAVRDAPTLDAARAAADRAVNTYQRQYPAAVGCFADNLEALLAIHRVPVRHRIRVRTTNLAERSFVEERRRTKVTGRLPDAKAAMKLVFATMIRAADRWCRVSVSDLERHQLRLLRTELGLDPPPATDEHTTPTTRRKSVAA